MSADLKEKANGDLGFFDQFAEAASVFCSRAPFFTFCILIIVLWSPTLFLMDINTSQLIVNTVTTCVTFLLVALIQNSTKRAENSFNYKLNAIADGIADILESSDPGIMQRHAKELREAVGLEKKMGA